MVSVKQIIYLLDTSGSISEGNKLESMNGAMRQLCDFLKDAPEDTSLRLEVSIYTFSDTHSGTGKVLTPIIERASTDKASDCWMDIPMTSIFGGTPLGQALKELAEILLEINRRDSEVGDRSAAPAIVILSDGEPTYTPEGGVPQYQPYDALMQDLEVAVSTSYAFAKAIRAAIALEVAEGSDAEKKLFALAHGSHSISKESLCYHASDNIDDLADALWAATLGTLSQ